MKIISLHYDFVFLSVETHITMLLLEWKFY